jgi:hypothetical protein
VPNRLPHSCGTGGCKNIVPAGQAYCDVCAARQPSRTYYAPPHIAKLYNSSRWRQLAPIIRKRNPICQFLSDFGVQCQNPATICHHLVDPKDSEKLFWEWFNIVAVCAAHHQGGQRGETQGYKYAHTVGFSGQVYSHGFLYPCWHENYKPMPAGQIALAETGTTAVGTAAILAALNEPI